MVDRVGALDIVPVIGELSVRPVDLVLEGRGQQRLPIGAIEERGREADLAHGRAHVPQHPGGVAVARRIRLRAAELGHIGKKAAVAQHFGKRTVVEPALVPALIEPAPHDQDDGADDDRSQVTKMALVRAPRAGVCGSSWMKRCERG